MATNIVYEQADQIPLDVSGVNGSGTGNLVLSGDPVAVGNIPGVALTDEDSDGIATVKTNGAATLMVEAEGGAITPGADLYYDDGDGQLNNSSSGNTFFGRALEAVDNAATAEILVKIGY